MKSLHRAEDIYRQIVECLGRNERAVLATVISRLGSGPREPGAMMLVFKDGRISGTVGGGLLEARVLESAEEVLQTGRAQVLSFTMTNQQASECGMICGGRMEVLLESPDGSNPSIVRIWERISNARSTGRNSRLVRSLRSSGDRGNVETGLGLLDEDGFDAGTLGISGSDADKLREQCSMTEPAMAAFGKVRYFVQPTLPVRTVFIFGAGHVAWELAPLCGLIGFRAVVIDDRREFANEQRFPGAADIIVPASFAGVFDDLEINPQSFIVIMTRGHEHDKNILSRALQTPAEYIGMIASSRKRDIIFRSLLEEGFAADDLKRVRSPIGLDIGARTPAEIAVSITAEMIAVRAGRILTRVP